jgi:hypothetical protein
MTVRKLDFVVIGAPKSGTTSLFQYLRQHPEIYIPAAKEAPFFSDHQRFDKGWENFAQEFFPSVPAVKLLGKVTPQYWLSGDVPRRMHRLIPEVKLAALLRNPVDRAFSHYRFLVRRGVEPRKFPAAVFDPGWKKYNEYVPPGQYGRILGHYRKYFPPEQFLVLFTDDLEERPQTVIDSMMSFLELETGFVPRNLYHRFNVGGTKTRFPWLIPTLRNTSAVKRLWQALPSKTRMAIGKWYFFEVAPVREPPQAIPAEVRQRLVKFYKADVLELESLIGRRVPWLEFCEQNG